MITKTTKHFLAFSLCIGLIGTALAQDKKKGGIQAYDKVVTSEAKTDEGLFKVHQIDDKYLFEIPDSLFEREMLMVTRIARNISNNRSFGGQKPIRKY